MSISLKQTSQHSDMSDRGPDSVKEGIQTTLDNFLSEDTAGNLRWEKTNKPIVADPRAMGP